MPFATTTKRSLSGHWEGYYSQHDAQWPIIADLDQEGERLTGTMNDVCTVIASSISELAMREGLPPGADEQIVQHVRSLIPNAQPGPVLAEVHLPPLSVLEGEVIGLSIQFRKTYQGLHFVGYRIGDLRVGRLGAAPEVLYRGRLNGDGTEIEGRWQAAGRPELGITRCIEGGFWLRRVEGEE
ncbi:MAG: hypothetical protein IRY99_12855 [Isosphaeraceae bacterium]|nr:hypothetical protein [Isosphaeraceae bacterium]